MGTSFELRVPPISARGVESSLFCGAKGALLFLPLVISFLIMDFELKISTIMWLDDGGSEFEAR